MKKIQIKGGLGNQMFQYAHGRKLQIIDKQSVTFDISFFDNIDSRTTKRLFGLNIFNIPKNIVFTKIPDSLFQKLIKKIKIRLNIQEEEYFQGEKHFKGIEETIRDEFRISCPLSPKTLEWSKIIEESKNSISVHIRRGDYVTHKGTVEDIGLLDLEYYKNAVSLVKENLKTDEITLFFFSDDIEWVKENTKFPFTSHFVSNGNLIQDFEEMFLISRCKNNINANSTFSWWGSWLNSNPKKIVTAPKKWFVNEHLNKKSEEIIPKDWLRI